MKHIDKIHDNNAKIRANEACIQNNKQAIAELRQNYVPLSVVCLVLMALFVCNAIWLYAWKQIDFGDTTITQGGETNHVGGE